MADRCADLEHLHSAWVDGELRTAQRARLAAHLQRCARCRSTIAELRVTQSLLRSMPVHRLPVAVEPSGDGGQRRHPGRVRRLAARSTAGLVAVTMTLGIAAFAAGGEDPPASSPVPVDVYVADHLVRAVGGPVSTPALFNARP
jgi:anti-sigma factor RsiW